MATSGSIDFNQSKNQIIYHAFQLLGIYAPHETPSADDIQYASDVLNMMVKEFQVSGINLWSYQEAQLILNSGQASYNLGASSTDNVSSNMLSTTLFNDASGTSINVVSTSGMTVGDRVAIVKDDGTLFNTTISSITDADTVVIADAIDPDLASEGQYFFYYTNRLNRPLDVTQARLSYTTSSGFERELLSVSREEYMAQTNKLAEGKPVMYYYDPQLTNGKLYVWPTSDNSQDTLKLTVIRTLDDFDNPNDSPDFPQEWLSMLVYNLAARMAPTFGRIAQAAQAIFPMAEMLKQKALEWDNEKGSMRVGVYPYYNQG